MLCSTASFAPQVWRILKTRDTDAISTKMYALTVCGFMLWLVYGLSRQDWPLVIANGICLVLSATILALKLKAS